jgi:hypothetical protein
MYYDKEDVKFVELVNYLYLAALTTVVNKFITLNKQCR